MRMHTLAKLAGIFLICFAMASTASAQYGGGTTGMPNYTYGSGKAIGIGIGIGIGAAAGAAVGIALLVRHYHHKAARETHLIGCTQPAESGISLKSEADGQTYMLRANGQKVKAGERVELEGVLKGNPSRAGTFRISSVVTDFGACNAASAQDANSSQIAVAAK